MTSTWGADELDRIGSTEEVQIAPVGVGYTTIWVVRVGDDLYVRSYRGRGGVWFRAALQRHEGRIRAGDIERDVTFVEPDDVDQAAIDQAYRSKYAAHSRTYVDPMVAPTAVAATLRLIRR